MTIQDTQGLPPAVSLLLAEVVGATTWTDARKRVKALLPDLKSQSEAHFSQGQPYDRSATDPMKFKVHLHGALDLFTQAGCSELQCRLSASDRLARSVGLIADEVWLTDTFTPEFCDFGRATNARLDQVVADTVVLTRILPLLVAGIVKFRPSVALLCKTCYSDFQDKVARVAGPLAREFRRDFHVNAAPTGGYSVSTGRCYDPPLIRRCVQPGIPVPAVRDITLEIVSDEVRSALWAARDAANLGGSVLSNSRLGLAALLQSEGRLADRSSLLKLEREREFSVPWVSSLSPEQIVQLRDEAWKALPSFRRTIAEALSYQGEELGSRGSGHNVVARLKEQADSVREELCAKRSVSARYWRTTYALLGLGLSAYGVFSDQPAAGVGGLLPILQLLIEHKGTHEGEIEKLERRPGYVLVKAQEILAHAHDQRASGA